MRYLKTKQGSKTILRQYKELIKSKNLKDFDKDDFILQQKYLKSLSQNKTSHIEMVEGEFLLKSSLKAALFFKTFYNLIKSAKHRDGIYIKDWITYVNAFTTKGISEDRICKIMSQLVKYGLVGRVRTANDKRQMMFVSTITEKPVLNIYMQIVDLKLNGTEINK